MKRSAEEIRRWVQIISDDYMHFTDEEMEYVAQIAGVCDFEIIPDGGVIGYSTAVDFDCKKKLVVILLYCRPEQRGRQLIPMLRRIEEIAKQEGAESIFIGESISGYKEDKFNKLLGRFGYAPAGFSKRI